MPELFPAWEHGRVFRLLTVAVREWDLPEVPLPIGLFLLIRFLNFVVSSNFYHFGTGIAASRLDGDGPVI